MFRRYIADFSMPPHFLSKIIQAETIEASTRQQPRSFKPIFWPEVLAFFASCSTNQTAFLYFYMLLGFVIWLNCVFLSNCWITSLILEVNRRFCNRSWHKFSGVYLPMATLFLINNCPKETLCCDCMPEAVVIKKVYDKTFLPASPLGSPVNKSYTLLLLGLLPTNEILVGGVGNC